MIVANKLKAKLKFIFLLTCSLLAAAGIVVLLGFSIDDQQKQSFRSIKIDVDQSNGMMFLDQQDIFDLLKDHQLSSNQSIELKNIPLARLEQIIKTNAFVDDAEIFTDASRNITITIRQRTPILRVINNRGVSYYIDDHARKMPLSGKFTARVPVATGNILSGPENDNKSDSVTEKQLIQLALFISRDTFLSSLTEQINVNEKRELELIPAIGNHVILLGDTTNLEHKFNKLKIFYREGLNRVGWNHYKVVNLKYENQVYCTKWTKADSTKRN